MTVIHTSTISGKDLTSLLVRSKRQVGEICADLRGFAGAEFGVERKRLLPMALRDLVVAEDVYGACDAMMRTGLLLRVVNFRGDGEGPLVVVSRPGRRVREAQGFADPIE